MPFARAAARCLRASASSALTHRAALVRTYASGHGEPSWNEPSGYLFGEKPPAPGEKRKREAWEWMWYIGMYGGLGVTAVLLYFQPDTRIQTWALKEAEKRLDASGEKWRYEGRGTTFQPPKEAAGEPERLV